MGIIEQIIGHLITHGLTNTPEKQFFVLMIGVMVVAAWFLDYALKLFSSSPVQSSFLFVIALVIGGACIIYAADTFPQQCACVATVLIFLVARRMRSKSPIRVGKAKDGSTSPRRGA